MLEQLCYELATLTPMAWANIFRRRFVSRQQQQPQSGSLVPHPASTRKSPLIPHSQPRRRCSLVSFCARSVAAQLVRLEVNS